MIDQVSWSIILVRTVVRVINVYFPECTAARVKYGNKVDLTGVLQSANPHLYKSDAPFSNAIVKTATILNTKAWL